MNPADKLNLRQNVRSRMNRGRELPDQFLLQGKHEFQLFDALGFPKTDKLIIPNGIVTTAKNDIFTVFFNDGTKKTSWHAGLINNAGFVGLSNADTYVTHTGWTEYTNYKDVNEATNLRVPWGQGTASAGEITNASPMIFRFITAVGSVAGIFICSHSAKGDATSNAARVLWSTALFGAALNVDVGDELRVTYTLVA
jgi:hypothetical protein